MGLPVTHWINMGLNTENSGNHGAYAFSDDEFSRKSKLDNNTNAINNSIKNRLKSLGITGFYALTVDKLYQLLGDPLFGYGKYQAGFSKAPDFYITHESTINKILSIISTSIILMLIIKMISGIRTRNFKTINEREQLFIYLVGIASFGLMLLHIVFWEVEPRYFLPLLYPLLLLSILLTDDDCKSNFTSSSIILNNKYMIMVIGVGSLILTLVTGHETIKPTIMTSGNWEHEARIALFKQVPLTHTMTFKLPVDHDSNSLIINVPANTGIKIETASKMIFNNENNLNVFHDEFKKGSNVVIKIHPKSTIKNNTILLYKEPTLYKHLFHGSNVNFNGNKYYLPYQFTK